MSLDQLRYFVSIAEEEHMGRAARNLRISQPPLSRHLRALEDELGVPLFERTGRNLRLLPAGQRLLIAARSILTAVNDLPRVAEGKPQGERIPSTTPPNL